MNNNILNVNGMDTMSYAPSIAQQQYSYVLYTIRLCTYYHILYYFLFSDIRPSTYTQSKLYIIICEYDWNYNTI